MIWVWGSCWFSAVTSNKDLCMEGTFVWCNESLPLSLGNGGITGGNVTGVIWHGTHCRALWRRCLSPADELTSRNMWNNNDRVPADRFGNVAPHDPQTIYPHPALRSFLNKCNGLLITVITESVTPEVFLFCFLLPKIVILLSESLCCFMCE